MILSLGKKYLFACVLGSLSQISFGAEVRILTQPHTPRAYEPFIIQVPSTWTSSVPAAVDIAVNSDQINIRYVRDEAGILSPALPLGASVSGLPPGNYEINVEEIQFNDVSLGWVTVSEPPPTIPVYSIFLASAIHRYFLTADEAERSQALNNDVGFIIDEGFNAWPAEGPAPSTAKPVCSFFSNAYGYSIYESHFYTADEEECNFLQSFDSGWEYKGIAFQALVPVDGSCPSGTTPVWRLYNNEGHLNNSNHRYVTRQETYQALIANKRLWTRPPEDAEKWIGEGVVFCSPLANEE